MSNFDDILNNAPSEQRPQLSKEEYAEKKKAERDAIFELSDNTALEVAGDGGMFEQYLDVQSKFDRYSTVNALLIMAQEPDATRVGDFDFWKERGGYVKKGESGITILEPHPYTKEDDSVGTGYNLKKVFDISQVDTRKVQAPTPPPKYTERQILQALVSKAPVKIIGVDAMPDYVPKGQGAIFNLKDNQIIVQKGMDFKESFQSVAQELALVEVGRDPNNTPDNPQFSAYSAAYMLCKKYGVDTQNFDFSGTPDVLDGLEAQDVKGRLSQIRDIAENITGRMARQFDAISKAAKNQETR